ncbi:MAG: hypothetical protein IT239_06970 [Bacteroidia bacterium]|nr:hypothetical protein [Bacteroidia bacterium]
MDLQQLFHRFNDNLNYLKSRKNVNIGYLEIAPPAQPEIIERLNAMGVFLPDMLLEFYSACNGIVLNWDYSEKEEGFSYYGWINIAPIEQMFGGLTGDIEDFIYDDRNFGLLYNDFLNEDEINFRKNLLLLESIEGDNSFVCLNYEENRSNPSLVYLSDFDHHSMDITLENYLGLLIDTMGMEVFRQMAVLQEDFDANLFDYEASKKLQEVFPWFNFDEIQESYFG